MSEIQKQMSSGIIDKISSKSPVREKYRRNGAGRSPSPITGTPGKNPELDMEEARVSEKFKKYLNDKMDLLKRESKDLKVKYENQLNEKKAAMNEMATTIEN
mmetsp:Transcript_6755/g.11335  ORF Transcript_6755/g.11335 Transcript_6755/m.11335 type:complete len:102 (+) Transcript_6755:475-780(+)